MCRARRHPRCSLARARRSLAPATAAGRHLPRLRLRGRRRATGATARGPARRSPDFVVDTDCTPRRLADRAADRRRQGDRERRVGRRSRSRARPARRSPTSRRPAASTSTRTRRWTDTRPLYALYLLGGAAVRRRRRLRHADARPAAARSTPGTATRRATRRSAGASTPLRQMGALAGYRGDARTLAIRSAATGARRTAPRPAGGRVYHVLYGIDVTVRDAAAAGADRRRRGAARPAARAAAPTPSC